MKFYTDSFFNPPVLSVVFMGGPSVERNGRVLPLKLFTTTNLFNTQQTKSLLLDIPKQFEQTYSVVTLIHAELPEVRSYQALA